MPKQKAQVKRNRVIATEILLPFNNRRELLLDLKAINAVMPSTSSGGASTICYVQGSVIEVAERFDEFSDLWSDFKEQQ